MFISTYNILVTTIYNFVNYLDNFIAEVIHYSSYGGWCSCIMCAHVNNVKRSKFVLFPFLLVRVKISEEIERECTMHVIEV